MRKFISSAIVVLSALLVAGCGGKDANTQLCLTDAAKLKTQVAAKDNAASETVGLVYQTCGISCDIVKDADACAAFKDATELICKMQPEACKTLCEGEGGKKNEIACALAK